MKNRGGCKALIGIMMSNLEFSFAPFGRDIKKESKFFTQNFKCIWYWKSFTIFAGIGNNIASDITNAGYLHQNIVRRDIKPSNVLVMTINNH